MGVTSKLKTLKAGQKLRSGGLIAHRTSTLPGIAASAYLKKGIRKAQQFKRRHGPFLLLADSVSTALKQAVYLTPSLRMLARQSWPGAVTLVFHARQTLDKACYQKGFIAVRVDGDIETRRLAKSCGGLVISSSFNRKGESVQAPSLRLRYRLHRHLSAIIPAQENASGTPSQIFRISGNRTQQLR